MNAPLLSPDSKRILIWVVVAAGLFAAIVALAPVLTPFLFAFIFAYILTPGVDWLQRRRVPAGETIGYSATFTAPADMDVAILNIGYADGYLRCFSGVGMASAGGVKLPVLGVVSMDLIAVGVDAAPGLGEGDWVSLDYDLPATSALSGLSQYELLTGLGRRFDRVWG